MAKTNSICQEMICEKIKGECVCHIEVDGKPFCELGEKFISDIDDCPETYDSFIDTAQRKYK